eukprot:TRINITY_DN2399_c0_g1_i2.p1 TRINITY_DN2399_c0_g1~~TRINITY_DN2399_c0_g1_i2.p1  ORF type:complete len:375 (-),score=48.55 TRINITY_DN2399_c0_g1_i2:46-1095(-)
MNNINIDEPIREVVISGLAVLKIIKHCRQYIPTRVTGQLLGLDANGVLEVTDSFVLPVRGASGEDDKDPDPEYELKMLHSLREVNVDNISVGWYISTFLGQHLDLPDPRNQEALPFLINTQFSWQSGIPNSVVILYDYLASTHGSLSLKALRLTKSFMQSYKNKDVNFKKEKLLETNFSFRSIFEEVPIRIDNQGLATALLYQLETDDSIFDQFESFDLGADDFMEKNLEIILSSLNDLQNRQNVHQNWQRTVARTEQAQQLFIQKRKAENVVRQNKGLPLLPETPKDLMLSPESSRLFKEIPEPWKANLESLILSYRIADQCHQVSQFAGQTLTKQYLTKTMYNANKN